MAQAVWLKYIDWYEAHGIGKVKMRVKKWL